MEFSSPAVVKEAIINRARQGVFGYTEEGEDYYKAIINWMDNQHNWEVDKNWICTSPGIVSGISLLVRALSEPGDEVILQTPVYFSFFPLIKNNDRQIATNPLKFDGEQYVMDLEDLENKISPRTKLLILCSPHNPVGRVWKPEELKRLGELCLKYNITIISDEIHFDLVFPEFEHTPFASLGEEFKQNCVVCTSPSKTFNLPGLHPGNMIIPNPELRMLYKHEAEASDLKHHTIFAIEALKAAYNKGQPWLEELITYLADNLTLLEGYAAENLPGINLIKPEGTYLAWFDCRQLDLTEEEFTRRLKEEAGVALTPGSQFGQAGQGFQRLNFACPESMLREALERIKAAVS
jgi:cystathionine beta-lyase